MAFDPKKHLMQLKGKDYLEVKYRLVWFREDKPNWGINTSMLSHDIEAKAALFKAIISDDTGRVIATGHGSETARDFGDYIEKAETKAIGRALAMCGYGTQFAPELEEGDRIVDAPVVNKTLPAETQEPEKRGNPAANKAEEIQAELKIFESGKRLLEGVENVEDLSRCKAIINDTIFPKVSKSYQKKLIEAMAKKHEAMTS